MIWHLLLFINRLVNYFGFFGFWLGKKESVKHIYLEKCLRTSFFPL